jgi:hypothetical protein
VAAPAFEQDKKRKQEEEAAKRAESHAACPTMAAGFNQTVRESE